MKTTYNWLKDFVDIKVSPLVLAQRLTMAGLEVTSLERFGDDTVLEIEVTANRPDCLSVLGIAQEVAAITKSKIKNKKLKIKLKINKSKNYLKPNFIKIEDKKGCVFYRGCLITDVGVGPSPDWLKRRIESLGVRSVNNIVDITNYCLFEYGQPLHAFDYDKIIEQIIVRRAKRGEKILTIDGIERQLDEDILVISDKNKAIAVAGIMGDKLSEVASLTKNILLESAYFDPILIRRASRRLGLSSESSYRFERGVNFDRVMQAQDRAVELICDIARGKLVDEKEAGKRIKHKTQQIKFDCKKANRLLSLDIGKDKIRKIFACLGLLSKNLSRDALLVDIPTLRGDISFEEDLIEELARIYGYNNIPSTLPAIRSVPIENSEQEVMKSSVRQILSALGFNEAISYSLASRQLLESVGVEDALKIENPLSSEQAYLRPTLSASLLDCLAYNLNRTNIDLRLFELSHIFGLDYCENLSVGLIATGKFIDNWQIKKEFDFFSLKGTIENFLHRLRVNEMGFLSCEDQAQLFLKGAKAKVVCGDKEVGVLGKVDNQTLLKFGIKSAPDVFYAQISLTKLCGCVVKRKRFQPLSIYPSLVRDISLIAKSSVSYADILDALKIEAGPYLKNVKLIDTYKGDQIPKGSRGLTVSLELAIGERTLTDAEATNIQSRIVNRLKTDLGISVR